MARRCRKEKAKEDARQVFRMILGQLDAVSSTAEEQIKKKAFDRPYEPHGGENALWNHTESQRALYDPSKPRFPFVSILQSSGYGKSKLVMQVRKTWPKQRGCNVAYISFASDQAYPEKNAEISTRFCANRREILETELETLFESVVLGASSSSDELPKVYYLDLPSSKESRGIPISSVVPKTLIVIDEVTGLLEKYCSDGVSFFRCLSTRYAKCKQFVHKCS